jgi:DnaJ-class molecular chaperone
VTPRGRERTGGANPHWLSWAAVSTGDDPTICRACRGTGKVISGLGGTPHEVVCPWCEGTGHRIAGLDAQEHPSEGGGAGEADETARASDAT